MPELPDVTVYVDALEERIVGQTLRSVRFSSPFVLRSVNPPKEELIGRSVTGIERIGKRIVIALEDELFIVIHLMIAGRFRWKEPGAKLSRKLALAALDFDAGSLILSEAGSKKRASIHFVSGREALGDQDPGGAEPLAVTAAEFRGIVREGNHTLKRTLTDPRKFSGIGNAFSDEILHTARLSPIQLTSRLTDEEIDRLHTATRDTLTHWIELLRAQRGDRFPEKVTAFRPEMAVHGKFGQACPVCGSPVQRIVYSENETNYCATCQTGGKVLRDRALSRLLREDWPDTL